MSPGDVRDASASSTSNKLRTAIRFSPNDYSAANKSKERKILSFYSVFPDSRRPPPPPSPRDILSQFAMSFAKFIPTSSLLPNDVRLG